MVTHFDLAFSRNPKPPAIAGGIFTFSNLSLYESVQRA